MINGDIAVRDFAEFLFRQGDLYPASAGRRVDAQEGVQAQQRLQTARKAASDDYQAEVPIVREIECAGQRRKLQGRIDGFYSGSSKIVIEEYKCCGELPAEPDAVDYGQLILYGAMYAANHQEIPSHTFITHRLVYVSADDLENDVLEERCFDREVSVDDARMILAFGLLCLEVRLLRHQLRVASNRQWAQQLQFPMTRFRPSQQAMARRVYTAVRDRENILLEAPTGSGKTLGVLFPTIKALGSTEQSFFLTSRNAGKLAAVAAADQLDDGANQLTTVEITAKEKTCFVESMPCDAERCPYAAGYFDRVGTAVDQVLANGTASREHIEDVAQANSVCPFELSLDAARWADLIIGDYNYLLDPVVRLKRFAKHAGLHVLVDEAHQLAPRVSDMLAVSIERRALKHAGKSATGNIEKRIKSVDRALLNLRKRYGQGDHLAKDFDSLDRALNRLVEAVAVEDVQLEAMPAVRSLYFDAIRWSRAKTWFDDQRFRCVVQVDDREVTARCICIDPSQYILKTLGEYGAVVRFSGTVSPLPLYQRLHGFIDAPAERTQSPFSTDQLSVMIVPDVPTYYRQRKASTPRLALLIDDLLQAHSGRLLVALPSFKYLAMVMEHFILSHPAHQVLGQSPGQSMESLTMLLKQFADIPCGVLFIVSGGSLGESVDFSDVTLCGVVLVGLGLPPPSLERDLMAEYFDQEHSQDEGTGQLVAYTQPALVKNVQAAGRLIRSPHDNGVICLVDSRFNSAVVRQFFPATWQPQIVKADNVKDHAQEFWHLRK